MVRAQLKTLTEPMFYLLLSLHQERHGYDIMQHIRAITHGRVVVGPGTLYALLARFEEEGYIRVCGQSGNRIIYRITPEGEALLQQETQRLHAMLTDYQVYGPEAEEEVSYETQI